MPDTRATVESCVAPEVLQKSSVEVDQSFDYHSRPKSAGVPVLNIRPEQVKLFAQSGTDQFENEMVAHLKVFAKRHCEVIGEKYVRETVKLGIANSRKYGFSRRGPTRFFIELMFMFGGYFDTDVQHPWASEVLGDPHVSDEMFRADGLHRKMLDYVEQVSGPQNAHARSALSATRKFASDASPEKWTDLRPELMTGLREAYPQKCQWLGEKRLGQLVDGGIRASASCGVTSLRGMALFAVLSFALGHKFYNDPLYPWIMQTLKDSNAADGNVRAKRLEEKALLYLDRVVEYLAAG